MRTENFQENLETMAYFITDLAVVDLVAKATRKEALAQQRNMEEKLKPKREIQFQLKEVKAVAERGSRARSA